MERNAAFRRVFHILSPAFLAYYLIPETLADGITRTGVSILFVGTALCIEIARIALGIRLLGLRPYEGQRVSAYAQGLLGLAFGLFVIRIRSFACTRSISSFHRLTETSEPSSSTAFASQTLPVDPDRLEKSRAAPFSRIVSSITSTLLSGRTSLTFIGNERRTPRS